MDDLCLGDEDEVTVFRRAMIPLIKEEMRNRKDGVYTLAPDICSLPLPESMATRLQDPSFVRFHYMNTWESKTMAWDLLSSPGAILAQLFANSRKVLKNVPEDAPTITLGTRRWQTLTLSAARCSGTTTSTSRLCRGRTPWRLRRPRWTRRTSCRRCRSSFRSSWCTQT